MSVISLSPGRNFMSLLRCNLGEADYGHTSSVSPQSTTVHSREGKDGKVCWWNGPAKVSFQSHLGVEVCGLLTWNTTCAKRKTWWHCSFVACCWCCLLWTLLSVLVFLVDAVSRARWCHLSWSLLTDAVSQVLMFPWTMMVAGDSSVNILPIKIQYFFS